MACEENNDCIPCSSTPCPDEVCPDVNYQDIQCATTFPLKCAIWTGEPIECLNIESGDSGDVVISKIMSAICDSVINSPDNLFRISAGDTTSGYFQSKVLAGTGIILTKNNTGGNETITISVNGALNNTPLIVNSADGSIAATLTGTANHTADLGVVVSPDAGNALSKRPNGLFAVDASKLKISSTDTTADYLGLKIIAGGNISIVKLNAGGNEVLQISTSTIGLTAVTTVDTDTIDFSGTGTPSNPLSAAVRISTNPLNRLVYDGTGLLLLNPDTFTVKVSNLDASSGYLDDKLTAGTLITITHVDLGGGVLTSRIDNIETPIVVTDTSTIDFTASGAYNHTITAAVKISAQPYNLISAQSDGIYSALIGTGLVKSTGGTISYITDNSANWDTAYALRITSLTVTGSSGAATLVSNTLNIPTYTAAGLGAVPTTRTLTINGTAFDLSANRSWSVGTVTSVGATAGTGISISGSPVTTSGSITITNTAPDQTVVMTAGTGISVSGTYPNFTITNTASGAIYTAGTGISVVGTVISNTAPDQTVVLTNNGGVTIGGSYPNFTLQVSTAYAPTSGSGNYIQNQIASAQATSNFWISGKGIIAAPFGGNTGEFFIIQDSLKIAGSGATSINGVGLASDTVGAGTHMQFTDTSLALSGMMQLSVAGHMDMWGILSSSWTRTARFLNYGGMEAYGTNSSTSVNRQGVMGSMVMTTTGTDSTQLQTAAVAGNFGVNTTAGNFTPDVRSKHAAVSGTVFKSGAGNFTGNMPTFLAAAEFSDATSTITTWSGFRVIRPEQYGGGPAFTGTLTNAVGLYIEDFGASSIVSKITNRFAIYQAGTSDISRFFGPVQNASSSVQFTSDMRGKNVLGTFGRGLAEIDQIDTKIFTYKYDPNNRNVVGLIAQELEAIMPEAVSRGNFDFKGNDGVDYSFNDYRMVDQTYLFYTMLNAIKELSAKVKLLENK